MMQFQDKTCMASARPVRSVSYAMRLISTCLSATYRRGRYNPRVNEELSPARTGSSDTDSPSPDAPRRNLSVHASSED